MAFQLPDGTLIRAPRKGRSFVIGTYRHPEKNLLSADFRARWAILEVPDPQPKPMTATEIEEREREYRQSARIKKLQSAVIDQFDMILALFQTGRDNGVWVAGDFPADLRDKVVEWRDLIGQFRLEDVPAEEPPVV